jgi:signal transduction histidine kinase
MSLQTKVSGVILLIVGVSAISAELIDRRYVSKLTRDNFQEEMAGVVRQIGADITSPADFNRSVRELELYKLLASRPDLTDAGFYELPGLPADQTELPGTRRAPTTEPVQSPPPAGPPTLLASAGSTALPRLERAPPVVLSAIESSKAVSDLQDWESQHRVKIAAPISLDGRVVGAAYAEFSTAQFDDVLDYQRRLSLTRRLLTETVIVLAINLFLYFKVHRPVRALLSAVESIAHGNMAAVAPVYSTDEIGRLATRFNLMVDRIRLATEENRRLYQQLQKAHDELQLRVDEATSEVRQKNRELVRTNELLSTAQREVARSQRLSAIGQVAATIAHKIGTPLTALSGHIQLLQEDAQMGSESRRRLNSVESQIDRTSKIIQDLLVYARKPELILTPLDLNATVEECVALLSPELDRRKVLLDMKLSPALEKVEGDAPQLQEVFCNIIENALDAMPGGGTLTVRTYPHAPDRSTDPRAAVGPGPSEQGKAEPRMVVEIADTGPGISPAYRDQIFQPFFTTKKAGRGTGLGLAIAVETVRAHGGQITVQTEPGKGATFVIELPPPGALRH